MKPDGILMRQSTLPVKDTMDRIVAFLTAHEVTIYARIDQQAEVARQGIVLRPVEYLLFGDPAKGGKLMSSNILSALDLPLKLLVWEAEDGKVQVAYNDAAYLQQRYALDDALAALISIDALVGKILS